MSQIIEFAHFSNQVINKLINVDPEVGEIGTNLRQDR